MLSHDTKIYKKNQYAKKIAKKIPAPKCEELIKNLYMTICLPMQASYCIFLWLSNMCECGFLSFYSCAKFLNR